MRRLVVALGVGLFLALLVGPAWAGSFHGGFRSGGGKVFIGHGRPFFHNRFFFGHRPFLHRGVIVPRLGSTVIVQRPFAFVKPFPSRVWVPGFWQWDGFRWFWVPGHWGG